MTIDEAIKQEQEKAKISYDCANKSIIKHVKTIFTEQEDNHKQVAEWLKELKEFHKSFGIDDIGDFSDGYHTFNQLYHQRAILFATIVNQNKNISWKSFKHEDGNYCFDSNGEWFIVGIDTPEGSYTYHYEKKYWDYFKCKELEIAKHWDGHTEEDVIRLLSLGDKNDL